MLKEVRTIKVGPTKLHFISVRTKNKFVHDWYGNRYRYNEARRGYTYIVAYLKITADNEALNPNLPPIYIYQTNGAELSYVGTMTYKFHRWEDYGTYLGNDHDFSNDFGNTPTISFDAGYEVKNDILKNPIFIMVGNENCASRSNDKFDRPPVSYGTYSCIPGSELSHLTVKEAQKLHTIEIFNRGKI